MEKRLLLLLIPLGFSSYGQSVIQTVNSGSIVNNFAAVSVGEIIIQPEQNQSGSGIISILAQVNQQSLEVNNYALSKEITVYPNPTVAILYFKSNIDFSNEMVTISDLNGKLLLTKTLGNDNAVNMESLSSGIYIVQLQNQKKSFKIIKH